MSNFKARILPVGTAIGLTVLLDQWTKQLAIEHLQGQADHFFFGELFRLTFVRNTGAFLSMGADFGPLLRTLLLEAFPALLLVALLIYIFRERLLNRWQVVGLALIVGGGLSNIVDRLLYGHVVDMMHMKAFGLQTGIFNVADVAIMVGMAFMLPFAFRPDPARQSDQVEA